MRAGIALAAFLWSSAALAEFRPVVDRPYRYETVETRIADGITRRFTATRSIVFHRTPSGYDATVTLAAIDEASGDVVGQMFRAATGALLGKPLRYRLDRSGAIVAVEDANGAIARIADAIEQMTPHRARSGDLRVLASPLRSLPPERKAAMLRSILTPVIAGAAADQPAGTRDVRIPSRPPLPPGTALAGVETVTHGPGGLVTIELRAEGIVDSAAPPETHGQDMAVAVQRPTAVIATHRTIDATTGLTRNVRERSETRVTADGALHTSTIETTITVRLAD